MAKHDQISIFLTITTFAEYKNLENLPYYSKSAQENDSYIKERCVLDVYYPANKKQFATVVWFHGGGLKAGKEEIPKELKNKGVAVIAVNYRLSPKVKVVECIRDAAAVAWAFSNIAQYGGRANKVFVSCHSAGGYLASMIGFDKS